VGTSFSATAATVGPWDPKLQHGGPVAALLGTRIELAAAARDMRVSQFALEFLGPAAVAPMEVSTSILRPGKKIALFSGSASIAGRPCVRASAWLLRTQAGMNEAVRLDDAPPHMPDTAATTYFESVPRFGYGDALEWRFAEGGFEQAGPATVWSRLRVAIVEGEEVSPLARVLAMVDSANGISAELDVRRYLFVPVNLTVTLARHPASEWVGMRAVTSLADDGIGLTRARLFDVHGSIGYALQSLFVEKR
jgi:hypothetical protein